MTEEDRPSVGSIAHVSFITWVPGAGFFTTLGGFVVKENDERLDWTTDEWMMNVDRMDWRTPPFTFANMVQYQLLASTSLTMIWDAFQKHLSTQERPADKTITHLETRTDIPESMLTDLEDIDWSKLEGESDDPAGS